MQQGTLAELTSSIAMSAARTSLDEALPLADSVILATMRAYRATRWTQDADFRGVDGVRFVERQEN